MTMSYLNKVQPVNNWNSFYHKYRGYVLNRTKDLPAEEREDIYAALYFIGKDAERSYRPEKGRSLDSWYFWYLQRNLFRLIGKYLTRKNKTVSVDVYEDDVSSYFNMDSLDCIEVDIDRQLCKKLLMHYISLLPGDWQYIVVNYFGIGKDRRKTFQEIANIQGGTVVNVQNKFRRAIKRLRNYLLNNNYDKEIGEYLDYEA